MKGLDERELGIFSDTLARGRVSAPPALRGQLRSSLLAAPLVSPRRASSGLARLGWLRPALAAAVILALLAGAGGSAAASSLPGDPAFALKRAAEQVQVALAPDDLARLDTLVAQTDHRLGDLETATATRQSAIAPATDEYLAAVAREDAALATVSAKPASAVRDAAIGRTSAASADHIAMLQSLASRLPDAAQHGIQRAIEAQQAVHGKSGNAPGRPAAPGNSPSGSGTPGTGGRPSNLPVTPGRGGPPSGVPGRP